MKKLTVVDLEVDYNNPIIKDCCIDNVLGGSIADLIYKAIGQYIIIVTPWERIVNHHEEHDSDNPHTWSLSDIFDKMILYRITFDGWEYKEGADYSERDYFRISGYTANKELIEDLESAMHCRYEFDLSYDMYNFDEKYNIR